MKKSLKIIWNILQVIIIIHVILITLLMFFQNKYGFSELGNYVIYDATKLDHKNISSLNEGDLVIIKDTDKLKKKDVAYYYAVSGEKYIILSGTITDVKKEKNNYSYTISDGTNKIIISSPRIIGSNIYHFPTIGKILKVVESKTGFIFFILLPIMIVFIYQVYQLLLILRYEKIAEDKNEDSVVDGEIL